MITDNFYLHGAAKRAIRSSHCAVVFQETDNLWVFSEITTKGENYNELFLNK